MEYVSFDSDRSFLEVKCVDSSSTTVFIAFFIVARKIKFAAGAIFGHREQIVEFVIKDAFHLGLLEAFVKGGIERKVSLIEYKIFVNKLSLEKRPFKFDTRSNRIVPLPFNFVNVDRKGKYIASFEVGYFNNQRQAVIRHGNGLNIAGVDTLTIFSVKLKIVVLPGAWQLIIDVEKHVTTGVCTR